MAVHRIPIPWSIVYADNNGAGNELVHPAGSWRPCTGMEKMRYVYECRAATSGLILITPEMEFADEVSAIDATVEANVNGLNDGLQFPANWTAVTTEANQYQLFRPAWSALLSSGTTFARVRVGGYLEYITS